MIDSGLREPESAFKVALKTGLAAVLLCSGSICLAGILFFGACEVAAGHPLESPGSWAMGIIFITVVLPLLLLASLFFTFLVSLSRCRTLGFGLVTACSALLVMALSFLVDLGDGPWGWEPLFFFVYPAPLLARAMESSFGLYLGAVFQCFVGGWLLGWYDRFWAKPVGPKSP